MIKKFKTMVCTSLAAVFVFAAVGTVGPCCPMWLYQPEPPKKE